MRSLLAFHPVCRFLQCFDLAPHSNAARFASIQSKGQGLFIPEPLYPTNINNNNNTTLVRCRARVGYDGAGFSGFQIQTGRSAYDKGVVGKRTVQGVLESTLRERFRQYGDQNQTLKVVASGRTDAGVHARGQAIHFDVALDVTKLMQFTTQNNPKSYLRSELEKCLNSLAKMLPPDICLWNLQVAPDPIQKDVRGRMEEKEWNSMRESTMKQYCYRIHFGRVMDPLERHTRWHPDHAHSWFDEAKFRRLLKNFEGTHDFRAFAHAVEHLEGQTKEQILKQRKLKLETGEVDESVADPGGDLNDYSLNTVRTVRAVQLERDNERDESSYRIDIFLEGALHKQVRNMVGTVVEVCRGSPNINEELFLQLLLDPKMKRDQNPAKPAPAHALVLEHVFFEHDEKLFGSPF